MDRRYFIRSSTILSCLPWSVASALPSALSAASSMDASSASWFLYDSRFPVAVASVADVNINGTVFPLQGDVTRLWRTCLESHSRRQPLAIAGVTTLSCHFCLQNLLREQTRVETETSRIDHDLFAWWITSQPRTQPGRA